MRAHMLKLQGSFCRATSFLLVISIFLGTLSPGIAAYAQEAETPPVVETSAPPADPAQVPEAPSPVTESTPASETNATQGEEGADGEDGQPSPVPEPEPGENGDDATVHEPAEDGGDGGGGTDGTIDPPTNDGTPTVIETGNASSSGGTGNTVNTVDTTVSGTSTPHGGSVGTSTQNCYPPPPPGYPYGCPPKKKRPPKNQDITQETANATELLNNATSTAVSGDNTAADPDGTLVATGDTDAFGYLISLFNVAITNSSGSILFLKNPMADALDFTQRIMDIFTNLSGASGNGACSFLGCKLAEATFNVITGNVAEVVNTLVVRSGSGGNTATSTDGLAAIDTGNANAFGSIVNFGNLQIVDSRYLVILMTNVGDLTGDIVLPGADFFKQLSAGAKIARGTSLKVDNGADITNNGASTAGSGGNGALGENSAAIVSGNADADAAEINFANHVGSPICFIVNVGDEWMGDVVGLPEGFTRAKAPFGEIICGTGGGERERVSKLPGRLKATTTNYAKILNDAIVDATTGGNLAAGHDALIRTGNADAFLQILNVVNHTIIGQDWIFALFTVSGNWRGDLVFGSVPGDDPINQVAGQLLAASAAASGGTGGGTSGGYTSNPKFEVTKTASINSASTPVSVDYTVTLKNVGEGAAYRAKLTDVLSDPLGAVISNRVWDLETVMQGETIKLTYTVQYNDGIPEGAYKNTVQINAFRNSSIYVHPEFMTPYSASATVEISGVADQHAVVKPLVSCKPLLASYLRRGKVNNPVDVRNLQMFLNAKEGERLDVSGEYTIETEAAVKRLQAKYTHEVLGPWGIGLPTGNVYYTTQKKINDLACEGNETFTLSESQRGEIDSFKQRFLSNPDTIDYGFETVGKTQKEDAVFAVPQLILPPLPPIVDEYVPQNTSQKKKSNQTAATHNGFAGIQTWLGQLLPFVEALEL